MSVAEGAGYLAAVLVFLTFYMKTMIPLRIVGICSNFVFIFYGYLGGLYPVLVLHLVLLPLNSWRLREMLRLTKQVQDATKSDLSMSWLKPFTSARRTAAGEILFRKGDPAKAMLFIVSGGYRLVELGISLSPGEVVGELGLLAPGQTRTQTVQCTDPGEVLEITYEHVKQLYFQNPHFGFYLLQLATRRMFANIAKLENELAASKLGAASSPLKSPNG